MNSKLSNFLINFSYSLTSNLVTLLISTLVVLIVPKLIGVEDFAYWQLYLFYSSYVGFMHFGWNDGIYLRYGGKEYKELDKNLFSSQFYMLVFTQLIIAIMITVVAILFLSDENRIFIIQMTALCLIIMNVRNMLLFILQSTNRIKEYAQITMIDKILFFALLTYFLLGGIRDYNLLVLGDLIGKFVSLLYAIYCCKEIVLCKMSSIYNSLKEAIENVNVGIKLMFANIASMLIIGTVRFGIERSWDVITFGKVSLTLSISNLMMVFINAIGVIMFPILRRTHQNNLPTIYITMRDILMMTLLGILIVYYPFKVVLSMWLPNYSDSFVYMGLLFPIFLYEGKMALLINTYLKTLRKEKLMLRINLISLTLSLILTLLTTLIFKDLYLAILSIVLILFFRATLAEILLSRILRIPIYKDVVLETVLISVFILIGWYMNSWVTVLLYGVSYLSYLVIKKRDITNTIKNLKLLVKA